MITHLSDSTLQRQLWLKEAGRCLLDYAPPGAIMSVEQARALMARFDAGYIAADAAEAVQAATPWRDNR